MCNGQGDCENVNVTIKWWSRSLSTETRPGAFKRRRNFGAGNPAFPFCHGLSEERIEVETL